MAPSRDSLLFHFEEKPRAVVAAIDELSSRAVHVRGALRGKWLPPTLMAVAGLGLIVLDVAYGYRTHVFAIAGVALLPVAGWGFYRLARARRQPRYRHPAVATLRSVVHTLRDDLAPKRNLHGTLDLASYRGARNRARSKKDVRGRRVSYYRDDWLTLKAKLYDGSMLRFVVVRRMKIRDAYFKRGRVSGKRKRKPEVVKADEQHVDVRVSANPALYRVSAAHAPAVGASIGRLTVRSVEVDGGLLRVLAAGPEPPTAAEILELLQVSYSTLQVQEAA